VAPEASPGSPASPADSASSGKQDAGEEEPLLCWRDGPVGRIELNRPRALNALNFPVVERFIKTLRDWRDDPAVATVVVTGAGSRGLCAGGDVRWVYRNLAGNADEVRRFWRAEYELNALVARFPKPYVAIMAGIVMGGGVGISAHGRHRVVTETSQVAMPEVGIGFTPDVGGTWLLARAPGQLGTHLALTSQAAGPGDAIACGLADRFVPADRIGDLIAALGRDQPQRVLDRLAVPAPPGPLAGQARWIDECYAGDSVEPILDRLSRHPAAQARAAAEKMRGQAPTALRLALRLLREAARAPDLETVLALEFRVIAHCIESPDMAEGIRAQVIDKDRRPRWTPPTLAEVSPERVDWFFTEPDPAAGRYTL
jgi:enoyl-CoA hydratase